MTNANWFSRLRPDNFTLALVASVVAASLLPVRGAAADVLATVTDLAIGLLFFLHGAKLSRAAIVAGATHWRLQLATLGSTFVLFPLLGALVGALFGKALDPAVVAGLVYLCILPSTVQSSIAFTSVAGGNVPAAICAASASNLVGIFLTPALAALMLHVHGAAGGDMLAAVQAIVLQLLAPFVAGHLTRPWLRGYVERHKKLVTTVDRGSILLVVYAAFSAAVVEGLWRRLEAADLIAILALNLAILAIALAATTYGARRLGFSRADEITLVFCGSKKSLASGVPMAGVLFPAAVIGPMLLPLMLFHQLQLMVCAVLARRYADQGQASLAPE